MGEKKHEEYDYANMWRTALIEIGKLYKHTKWEEIYHINPEILCESKEGYFFGIVAVDGVYLVLEDLLPNKDYDSSKYKYFKIFSNILNAARYLKEKYYQ